MTNIEILEKKVIELEDRLKKVEEKLTSPMSPTGTRSDEPEKI